MTAHALLRSGSSSSSSLVSAAPQSALLLKLLVLTTTFALACLCYYTVAFAGGAGDNAMTINSIGAAAVPHTHRKSKNNALVLAHAAKMLPQRVAVVDTTTADRAAATASLTTDTDTLHTTSPYTVVATPTTEQLQMGDDFYTSHFDDPLDMSTTIIFNVFKGEPRALELQLRAAASQKHLTTPPDVWVLCFASPRHDEYARVVTQLRDVEQLLPTLVFTASTFNHKFHGRFLLAYMATTKYVLIVDDDRPIDDTTVADYIALMRATPGVWGNFGHLRASTFSGYKSWPNVGYDLNVQHMAEQDYLSGMWFLQQNWLEFVVKERFPTFATSEDMHLSHVMRKYLNLNTYGGNVALTSTIQLPKKKHAATVGAALELREFVFDHQLGRGNKVANVEVPIQTLVYAETVADITDLQSKMLSCPHSNSNGGMNDRLSRLRTGDAEMDAVPVVIEDDDRELLPPWCTAGKTAVVFRGAVEQDVQGLVAAADALCSLTDCEYVSLKPKIEHVVRHYNMREGFGQHDTNIPWQTAVSDVLTSLVGVLNNVQPQQFLFPDVTNERWREPNDKAGATPAIRKKSRLQIYHNTVRLALRIHANAPTNHKWDNRDLAMDPETAFPTRMRVFTWQKSPADVDVDEAADDADAPMLDLRDRVDDTGDDGLPKLLYQEFSFE